MLFLASLAGGAEAAWRDGGPILHRVRSIDGLAGTPAEREIHALRRQKPARTAPKRKIDFHLALTAGAIEGAVPVHVRLERTVERRARVAFRLADILQSRLGRARALFGLLSRP